MADNGQAHFQIRRLNINSQTAKKTGNQSVRKIFDVLRFAVGSENNLVAGKMKSVKGVEEFFLSVFFAGNKLNVINQNTVKRAIFVLKLIDVFSAEGGNELVAKGFGGKILDFKRGVVLEKLPADSLHQMGFANTDSAPDKERIVGGTGIFNNSLGGSVSEIVAVANDKVIEGVAGVKLMIGEASGSLTEEGGGNRSGISLNGFLDNKFKSSVEFGLIVKSVFEKTGITFLIDVKKIGVGASDGSSGVFKGNKLEGRDEGLKNSRSKNDFKFFAGVFPKTV